MSKIRNFLTLCIILLLLLNISAQEQSTSEIPSVLEKNCLKRETPTKYIIFFIDRFGILTTTYIRSGSTKMFNDYLRRYAESNCDLYDNIYIIWNNQQTPEQMGVLANKDKWKKNVYFMQTTQNSLDFKYIVPPWVPEKVFFGMDDDFDITCQALKEGFQHWQNVSHGQVAPLVSFYGRSYVFQPSTQSFSYIDQIKLNRNWNYFNFGLTGIAFISRHFLELYYSDIYELKQMRKQVVQKNNCEDLLLNFLISYLYPQLTTQYKEVKFKSLGNQGVSATKTHKQYRGECISRFSQILGYNPVKMIRSKNDASLMAKKTNLHQSCMVNLKQQDFELNFINNRAYYLYIKQITGVDNDFIKEENKLLIKAKQDVEAYTKKKWESMNQTEKDKSLQKQEITHLTENDRKMLQQEEMSIHYGSKEQVEKYMNTKSKTQLPQIIDTIQEIEQEISQARQQKSGKKKHKNSQKGHSLSYYFKHYEYIIYSVILVAVILGIFLFKKLVESTRHKYVTVPLNLSNQSMSNEL